MFAKARQHGSAIAVDTAIRLGQASENAVLADLGSAGRTEPGTDTAPTTAVPRCALHRKR